MTRYMILSDIHGNLPALRAALEDATGTFDKVISLGDTIGIGQIEEEGVNIIRSIAEVSVQGNEDYWALDSLVNLDWDAPAPITPENCRFLASLPAHRGVEDFLIAHASPLSQVEFIDSHYKAARCFDAFTQQLCFVGHSHMPKIFELGSRPDGTPEEDVRVRSVLAESNDESFKLDKMTRYIVDVGSVGQYEGHPGRGTYCVYDTGEQLVLLRKFRF